MAPIKLLLTIKQTEILQPIFDTAGSSLGMIVGQFFESTEEEGFFYVEFVPEGKALELQRVMGVDKGSLTSDGVTVYTDVE